MQNNSLALYIHWPFCLAKCPYCDFNSHVANSFDYESWIKSYSKEIENFRPLIEKKYIKSIFFGGGTPSLMDPSIVKTIISLVADIGIMDSNTEITLEANPTSVEASKFQKFREAGVNRVSIGVQSLIEADLKKLGRQHNSDEAIRAVKLAKEIFDSYSFDLIYAREGQDLHSWQEELMRAIEIAGDHISLYQLTIEKATPFYSMYKKGNLILPPSDIAADMYEWTLDYLRSLGYKRYEISNYAKEGFESKHNMAYWNYDEYLGIGPGAHSRISKNQEVLAVMNYNKPEKWMNCVEKAGNGIQINNILKSEEVLEEIIMMGLRLETGITDKKIQQFLGKNFNDILSQEILKQYIDSGFIEFDKNYLKLTDKGLLMHSYIVPRIIDSRICHPRT